MTTNAPGPPRATGDPSPENNFNLLRLVFALAVVVYHVSALSGVAAWAPAVGPLSIGAGIGVQGFFVLSGYLVYGSLVRSPTLTRYAEKRIRRLYPAYAAVILICVVAALALSPAARADLGGAARYLGWNLAFLNFLAPNLPGLFAHNPVREVNGALWTLKIEVAFYVVLPLIAWLLRIAGARTRWVLIALIYVAAEAWRYAFLHMTFADGQPAPIELARQLPGQMSFFIVGVAFAMRRDRPPWRVLAPLGVLLLLVSFAHPLAEPLRALGLGVTAIWLATAIPRPFDAARFGDLSYGVYIVHFPIIQTLAALGLFAASPWLGGFAAIAASLCGALLMWRLVERPALRADSAYRRHD
jgi:peptidoglycan/LPS O-acetylase OafA/YrhL